MSELYLSSFHVPRSGYCLDQLIFVLFAFCELISLDMDWLIDFVSDEDDSLCNSEFLKQYSIETRVMKIVLFVVCLCLLLTI